MGARAAFDIRESLRPCRRVRRVDIAAFGGDDNASEKGAPDLPLRVFGRMGDTEAPQSGSRPLDGHPMTMSVVLVRCRLELPSQHFRMRPQAKSSDKTLFPYRGGHNAYRATRQPQERAGRIDCRFENHTGKLTVLSIASIG